jgi:hypothetical protein
MNKKDSLRLLQAIPGVGKSIAQDLYDQGFRQPSELAGQDPEALYKKQCQMQGVMVDRCLLYVFRCAVYYASSQQHEPELLKWWNWKDRTTSPF